MDLRVKQFPKLRTLPKPEDGLRALVDRAPQAEAWVEVTLERWRPFLTRLYVARRRLATAAVGILSAWLLFHVMFGANGMIVYRQKRAEYLNLRQEIDETQKDNDRYSGHIDALQNDPKAMEKEAREQLHYAKPGEVIYVAPPPAPSHPEARRTDAAHK